MNIRSDYTAKRDATFEAGLQDIVDHLQLNPASTTKDIALALCEGVPTIHRRLNTLLLERHLIGQRKDSKGRHIYAPKGYWRDQEPAKQNVAGPRNYVPKGTYSGAELRRPAGMSADRFRAFELDGMHMGKAVPVRKLETHQTRQG